MEKGKLIATRDGFGDEIAALGAENSSIYVVDVDIGKSCKAVLLRDGRDVALIANGDTVRLALEAADMLAAEGITARVLDMHTLKPLDTQAVNACIRDIGKIGRAHV